MAIWLDLILDPLAADSELNEISEEKWTARGNTQKMVESFSCFNPKLQKLLGCVQAPQAGPHSADTSTLAVSPRTLACGNCAIKSRFKRGLKIVPSSSVMPLMPVSLPRLVYRLSRLRPAS